ncbi:MAG: ATP-binding protein [Candidatus Izemoplasmatales bacterium]|jgi:hypothetical protein|nr:ATP-binding protein [Candidatus Izemoplasmatales bacterium]MDD4354690.1 ATP-binding protein [Candidatus Izemoplasmatales bacterium]MDD4988262.1 ATP-binding protein [Candidatus Izemoplasmatales bacterium]MDY0373751.1 ATP-binding protein [Candidatus Izemoplasmatales bacterium]
MIALIEFIEALFDKYGFSLEMLITNFMFVYTLRRRKNFLPRVLLCFSLLVLILYIWSFFETRYTYWDTIKYSTIVFITILFLMFCFKIPFRTAVFCEIGAFATQHSAYKVGEVFQSIAEIKLGFDNTSIIYFLTVPAIYVLFFFLFAKRLESYDITKLKNNQIILLTIPLTLVSIVLGQYSYRNDYSIYLMLAIYDILCCLLTLSYQYSLLEISYKGHELATLEQMLVLQKKQMKSSKHTYELFNVKFHDMKHQMAQLEGRINSKEIEELHNIISMCDINLKTGNEALDIILFEKAYECSKQNIKINCIADGNSLFFMRSSDIYSLFGNALDNSIEAVQKIDSDSKSISIHIKKVMSMISIHFENPYQGELYMFDELPQTTKADIHYHGFGMKSIRMIVEKYGGTLSIDTKNNLFQLNIIIPATE